MKTWIGWITIFIVCTLAVVGCVTTPAGDVVVDPAALQTADSVAAAMAPAGEAAIALSVFWPPLAIIGSLLVGAAGGYQKIKPKLAAAASAAEIGQAAGEATAIAIEQFKKAHPDEWDILSEYLERHQGLTVENFYRGLRGLPLKD